MSFLRHLYYDLKPHLPLSLRIAVRRRLARSRRARSEHIWPINPAAGKTPESWPGWPDGKKFALVLTHDVESAAGVAKAKAVADLEMDLGFRSSFNFIPEGSYDIPPELTDYLLKNGFEIGVHDLKHDGKLFRSKRDFTASAEKINHYLKKWNARGFRSGFMLRNLAWLHQLDIDYDMSTFDTDPFEPQPDGAETIFPFWVPANAQSSALSAPPPRRGYVELPYTLPQDSTLFLLLKETNLNIWKKKLDWIAERGGMVLLNTHSDYMTIAGQTVSKHQYPIRFYQEFLEYARAKYGNSFWSALPRDIASHLSAESHERPAPTTQYKMNGRPRRKVWIDLDNTPHVPFFKPIIRDLESRGYDVVLTARDAFQVCELAAKVNLKYTKVGRHYGKNRIMKVLGLGFRGFQLLPFALREKPSIGLSHGARSQMFLCNLLRIPTVLIMDYEHAKNPPLARPQWEIVPSAIPTHSLYARQERVRTYRGIKEDVYAPDFKPDPSLLSQLSLKPEDLIVTVRPPATEAHYHNPESELFFVEFMKRLCAIPEARAVLLPRNKRQEAEIRQNFPEWFKNSQVMIPGFVVDGLNLLWHSDLAVSGGGTMNREAAALGVPVYSIFRGKIGAVDRQLEKEGRLVLIKSVQDVRDKILIQRRPKTAAPDSAPRQALHDIVNHVEAILQAP